MRAQDALSPIMCGREAPADDRRSSATHSTQKEERHVSMTRVRSFCVSEESSWRAIQAAFKRLRPSDCFHGCSPSSATIGDIWSGSFDDQQVAPRKLRSNGCRCQGSMRGRTAMRTSTGTWSVRFEWLVPFRVPPLSFPEVGKFLMTQHVCLLEVISTGGPSGLCLLATKHRHCQSQKEGQVSNVNGVRRHGNVEMERPVGKRAQPHYNPAERRVNQRLPEARTIGPSTSFRWSRGSTFRSYHPPKPQKFPELADRPPAKFLLGFPSRLDLLKDHPQAVASLCRRPRF